MPTQSGDLTKEEILGTDIHVRADSSNYYLEAEARIEGRDVKAKLVSHPKRGRRPHFLVSAATIAEKLQEAYEDLPDEETEEPSAL